VVSSGREPASDAILSDPDLSTFGQKTVQFEGCPRVAVPDFTDASIHAARAAAEAHTGCALADDPKTGFPTFSMFDEHGNEWGGG
jgi:hypothetical protein